MKQLDLAQPLLLILMGFPGAGKSFAAAHLADEYSFAWIHSNRLRHELFEQPTFASNEEGVVNRLSEYMLEELFRTQRSVMFDSNATNVRSIRARLTKQAQKAGYRVLTVWVQTDPDTAQQRSLKKKPEDTYSTPLAQDAFDRLQKQFTPPASGEEVVVLSGKHTPLTQRQTLLRKLITTSGFIKKTARSLDANEPRPEKPGKQRPRFDITRRINLR